MNKKQFILIGGLVLLIVIINGESHPGCASGQLCAQKEWTVGGISPAALGIGAAASAPLWWSSLVAMGPWGWALLGVGGILVFAPSLITTWANLFRPESTIPIWVYLVGFGILLMFVMRKK